MATKSTPTKAPAPVAKAPTPVVVTPRMQADAVAAARGQAVANRLSSPENTAIARPVEQGSSSQANGVIGYNQGGGAIYGNAGSASANNSLNYASPDQMISDYRANATAPTIPNVIDSSKISDTSVPTMPKTSTYTPATTALQASVGALPLTQQTIMQGSVQGASNQNGQTIGSNTQGIQKNGSTAGYAQQTNKPLVNNQTPSYANTKIDGYMQALQAYANPKQAELDAAYTEQANVVGKEAQLQLDQGIAEKTNEINAIDKEIRSAKLEYQANIEKARANPNGQTRGSLEQELNRIQIDHTNKMTALEINRSVKAGNLIQANTIIDQTIAATKEKIDAKVKSLENIQKSHQLNPTQETLLKAMLEQEKENRAALIKASAPATGGGEFAFRETLPPQKQKEYDAYQLKDANLRKSVARAGVSNGSGYTPAQINSTINSIAGSFDNEPIVKNFNIQSEGYQFANSIPSNTKNPSDHQGLVYAFAKAMDPGSVVREGEYATVQKYAQSWAKAYGKGFEQAALGTGFLSETAIDNIKKTIKSRYDVAEKQYKSLNSEYNSRINKAKAGQGNSLTNYGTAFSAPSSKASSGSSYKDYQKLIK